MQIKRTDAHDRYQFVSKQADLISQGCQDCIKNRPEAYGNRPFYIYAHKRELGMDEKIALFNEDLRHSLVDSSYKKKWSYIDEVPSHRLIWQPRLSKPSFEINSYCFKYYPKDDVIHIKWMLPDSAWNEYQKGKMCENQLVAESIYNYINHKKKMEEPEEDDVDNQLAHQIMREVAREIQKKEFTLMT